MRWMKSRISRAPAEFLIALGLMTITSVGEWRSSQGHLQAIDPGGFLVHPGGSAAFRDPLQPQRARILLGLGKKAGANLSYKA